MPYKILITPTALLDIDTAVNYYNSKAADLGYKFSETVALYFSKIAEMPTASSVRYKDIRCKPLLRFPYLIMYTINEAEHSVNILRIFNTYQEPIW